MGDINHKLDNKVFTKEEDADKSIQRTKKPRTQAQIEATKKMLEGRKKWAENRGKENKAKKVAKLQEKIAKIECNNQSTPKSSAKCISIPKNGNNNIEENVEDNIEVSPNAVDSLLSNSNISILKANSNTPTSDDLEEEITPPNVLEDNRSLPINAVRGNASKSKPKRAKKVKRVVNNYIYENEEESSEEEEEIVNNHYIPKKSNAKRRSNAKRKPKKVVRQSAESSSDEETSSEEETGFVNYQDLYQQKPQKSIRFV